MLVLSSGNPSEFSAVQQMSVEHQQCAMPSGRLPDVQQKLNITSGNEFIVKIKRLKHVFPTKTKCSYFCHRMNQYYGILGRELLVLLIKSEMLSWNLLAFQLDL